MRSSSWRLFGAGLQTPPSAAPQVARGVGVGDLRSAKWQGQETLPQLGLGIDHRESLDQGDVAKSLIGANEMIDRGGRLNRQGHSELNRVEGVNLPRLPVLCDEISGPGLAQNLIDPE